MTKFTWREHYSSRLAMVFLMVCLFGLLAVQPASAQAYQTVSYGDRIFNTVTSSQGDHWYFNGAAGETVAVRMNSNVFDTYLEVRDSGWGLICSDDDSGGNLNAFIRSCRLPYAGNYTIVARGFSGATGHYDLDLQRVHVGTACTAGRPIGYGSRVNGSVTCVEGSRWTFWGARGDWVEINMRSNNMDSYLELHDANGVRIAFDDDGGAGYDARIYLHALPHSGQFTIVARGYSGDMGTYSLDLD